MNDKNRNSNTWNVINYRRIVPKRKWKDFGTVLLFCILFPYVVATFSGKVQKSGLDQYDDTAFVKMETENGKELIPLDQYIAGALAATIDLQMEEETLKAQAVVLRTSVMEAFERRENREENYVDGNGLGQEYFSVWQLRKIWQEEFETNFQKMQELVEKTDGIIMTYQGIAIKAPYFYVSAGRTRAGNEVFGGEAYPYLQGVEAMADFNCPEFTGEITYPESLFREEMSVLFEDTALLNAEEGIDSYLLKEDSAGYILSVSVHERRVPGEAVKEQFSLPSSCFRLEKTENGVTFHYKGKGHGVGFDQYGANEMAKEGKSYDEILKYYFTGIEIEKN